MRIVEGGLDDARVQALVALHQRLAREATAEGFAFALDLSGLRAPGIRFFSAWDADALLGVGALKRLAPDHGEVKSMHTAQAARRRGVGALLLRHIIAEARAAGMARVSLETGTSAYFQAAVALYLAQGFTPCGPFGDYAASAENRFLTRPTAAASG
ncbi:GNAT family N-acetyltransferase [Roseomonas sp. CECT 9278]|uniref:GNAT family N-acetyltransferase n=1 Tax=Roseomonas sp. CECT 9278 TaxID=2845823 RepID=UPI001E44D221|nr:GNAT family N-acetyltransferase [Roseomonas sp. CECT 9278]CAH0148022.1 putative N-acetyltransferase YsnE [Roseomonas sp. CECT 9278]